MGLSDRDAVQAFHAFGGYIQGFVMMEGGSIKLRDHGETFAAAAFETGLSPEEFPALTATHRYFGECDADEQFEFGLDLMLRGLRSRVEADAS